MAELQYIRSPGDLFPHTSRPSLPACLTSCSPPPRTHKHRNLPRGLVMNRGQASSSWEKNPTVSGPRVKDPHIRQSQSTVPPSRPKRSWGTKTRMMKGWRLDAICSNMGRPCSAAKYTYRLLGATLKKLARYLHHLCICDPTTAGVCHADAAQLGRLSARSAMMYC